MHSRTPLAIPDIRLIDRPASRAAKGAKAPETQLKPLRARRRVMVVDDDPLVLDLLKRILAPENYDLIFADSGFEALRYVEQSRDNIDLLITDYVMPVMNGNELAATMRRRCPGIKVLYQTGFSDLLFGPRVELEDLHAFLEKPYTARGLREAARLVLFGVINPPAE